jgi:hypothetical protein
MTPHSFMSRVRRLAAVSLLGTTFLLGGCDIGEFTTTSTVTLDTREIMRFLVKSWVVTPIENAIDTGIDRLFDEIQGNE